MPIAVSVRAAPEIGDDVDGHDGVKVGLAVGDGDEVGVGVAASVSRLKTRSIGGSVTALEGCWVGVWVLLGVVR